MTREWNGEERRSENRASLYEKVGALEVRVSHIEKSMQKLDDIDGKLDALTGILSQGKGVAKTLQILFYVVGPLVAAGYWVKDHLR